MPSICGPCQRSLHDACRGSDYCTCNHIVAVGPEVITGGSENNESVYEEDSRESTSSTRERRNKPDAALKDQQSTGRKRAAQLYPLDREEPCEWLGKSGMGGGTKPINGCALADNCTQQARHHGPDKNTLNNEDGNVHRIGHLCHNRWHAANDPDYQPGLLKAD